MNLENLPTVKGKRANGIYVVQAKFIEEEGYEPPQGVLEQCVIEKDAADDKTTDREGDKTSIPSSPQMNIRTGRWTLSEDPNDRKDSLWYAR